MKVYKKVQWSKSTQIYNSNIHNIITEFILVWEKVFMFKASSSRVLLAFLFLLQWDWLYMPHVFSLPFLLLSLLSFSFYSLSLSHKFKFHSSFPLSLSKIYFLFYSSLCFCMYTIKNIEFLISRLDSSCLLWLWLCIWLVVRLRLPRLTYSFRLSLASSYALK